MHFNNNSVFYDSVVLTFKMHMGRGKGYGKDEIKSISVSSSYFNSENMVQKRAWFAITRLDTKLPVL